MNQVTLEIPAAFAAEDVRLSAGLPLNLREFRPPLGSGAIIHSEQRPNASIFDPELLATGILLLAVLLCGGGAVWLAFRWFRSLKREPSAADEDFAQLGRALEEQKELDPAEVERIRAVIQRRKNGEGPGTKQVLS
jgi:hypothetical protein